MASSSSLPSLDSPRGVILLAGGRSRRMGQPKALLPLAGRPVIEHVLRKVTPLADTLVVVLAHPSAGEKDFDRTILEIVSDCAPRARLCRDETPELGPIAGLAAGLEAMDAELALTLACDMPFLSTGLLGALFAYAEEASAAPTDVVIPTPGGFLEPLCAVYRRSTVLPLLRRQIASRELKPSARFHELRVQHLADDELRHLDPEHRSFVNLNTPADYERAQAMAAASPGCSSA